MTTYEKLVNEGKLEPLNGMDILLIQNIVEGIIKGVEIIDDELYGAILSLKNEIEYVFADEPTILENLKIKLLEYNPEK